MRIFLWVEGDGLNSIERDLLSVATGALPPSHVAGDLHDISRLGGVDVLTAADVDADMAPHPEDVTRLSLADWQYR